MLSGLKKTTFSPAHVGGSAKGCAIHTSILACQCVSVCIYMSFSALLEITHSQEAEKDMGNSLY